MRTSASMPRLKGFRFPREIVSYAVWAHFRFALSTADVEDLLAERGVMVTRERSGFGSTGSEAISRIAFGAIDQELQTNGILMKSSSQSMA